MNKYEVIVVGSGVMGMSIARALSKRGATVAVIDRDKPGLHASYKAGGMLGAQNEFTADTPLFRLARISQRRFEQLSTSLYDETGIDIEYRQSGLLKLAAHPEDNDSIMTQYRFLKQFNSDVTLLDDHQLMEQTQGEVQVAHTDAIWIPDDHQINANHYTKALFYSLKPRHITRYMHTEVQAIHSVSPGYEVETTQGTLYSEQVVVAGGAWTHQLLPYQELRDRVTGVKGEVLLFEHPELNLHTTLFMTNGCYIVPKAKQRYLVGATSYVGDYSVGVSQEGYHWLYEQATAKIPNLQYGRLLRTWSGIRPYTLDEQPIMDEVEPGLFVITGHYRNGILLSPIIGDYVADWISTTHCPELLQHFKVKGETVHDVHH